MARNPNAGPTHPNPVTSTPTKAPATSPASPSTSKAIHAMRKAASIVRYCTLTLRDEADRAGTPHSPPRTDGSLDDTPKLARWVALANAYTLTTAPPPENVVHAIAGDLITAETATYRASTLAASTGHLSTSPATTTTPATSVNASCPDGCGPRSEPKSCLTSCVTTTLSTPSNPALGNGKDGAGVHVSHCTRAAWARPPKDSPGDGDT